jgi:hypothetical protein
MTAVDAISYGDYKFLLSIGLSAKESFRISLHFQEHNSTLGLVRVDYKSRHQNPFTATDSLPELFTPYLGLMIEDPHIHFHVQGYKTLDWAIPLKDYEGFLTKSISSADEFMEAVKEFLLLINLQNLLTLQPPLFIS